MTSNDAPAANRPRVVVIDDERSVREMLEVGLGQEGFAVRSAPASASGLALVRAWELQCIVLDVMMPEVDGVATIPMIRRLTESPIVMPTARGEVRDRIAGIAAGADEYLPKPFDLAELAIRIRAALRRPQLASAGSPRVADLEIDLDARETRRGAWRIALSAREFDLLVASSRSCDGPLAVTERGREAEIRVVDGGPGIPERSRARILALAIAWRAVERCGGRIRLEDGRPGRTTFALAVPLAPNCSEISENLAVM